MSRTTAPLLSFDARGQIAQTQVYSSWKGRPYVRRYVIPANPNTSSQQETRNTFSFLTNVWKFMPGSATAAWLAYAVNNKFTDRNGFLKINLSPLRSQADLNNFTFSPSANSGLAAQSMTPVGGALQIAVTLVQPTLPTGWAVASAYAAVIKDQDPQSGTDYIVTAGADASDPYVITLTGLTAATTYQVGGWFSYTKPDGTLAYGQALQATAATS